MHLSLLISIFNVIFSSFFLLVNYVMPFQAVIKKKYGQDAVNVGDEGGFAPNIQVDTA